MRGATPFFLWASAERLSVAEKDDEAVVRLIDKRFDVLAKYVYENKRIGGGMPRCPLRKQSAKSEELHRCPADAK